ncbi:histidine kinase [Pseudahrensia aquimaris]|uniref:Histidine kinase n=1 Tax=Pseudahrensia aquimaris TaxID=744461 RepID=A0ABW3FJI1_9HYPH
MAQAAFATPSGSTFVTNNAASKPKRGNRTANVRPVDLVHLAKQSLGDRALEIEILSLFRSQSKLYLDRLTCAKTSDERKMAAHTILGSARGIGAWAVAEEAEKIELSSDKPGDMRDLTLAIGEAQNFIGTILDA